MLRLLAASILLASLSWLPSCDGGSGGGGPAPADAAVTCCPIEQPTCDCFSIGGSPDTTGFDECASICDADPSGWELQKDSNGCPIWVGSEGSCLEPWVDAGVDAGAVDAAPELDGAGPADAS